MPKFIPSVVDTLMEKIYPPIVKKEIFGLVNVHRTNPRLESSQEIARAVLWTGSGGFVLFLLVLHIPQAVSKTTAMAQIRESKSDALSDSQPSSSVMLYNSALSLASDPIHETSIRNKIKRIDKRIAKENNLNNSMGKAAAGAETIRLYSGVQPSSDMQEDAARKDACHSISSVNTQSCPERALKVTAFLWGSVCDGSEYININWLFYQ
jgi:hypothetical protein